MKRIYKIVKALPFVYWPIIYNHKHGWKQIIKYIISGGTASLVQIGLFYILIQMLGKEDYLLATSVAFIFALMVSFTLQKFWTFRDNKMEVMRRQFTIYGTVALINLFLNGTIMYLLVTIIEIHEILAQIIAMGVLAIGSFLFHRNITFNNNKLSNESINNNRSVST